MKLIKLFQIIRSYMARKTGKRGEKTPLDQLRVQMIPSSQDIFEALDRRKRVRKILTLMYQELRRKGRPSIHAGSGDKNAA